MERVLWVGPRAPPQQLGELLRQHETLLEHYVDAGGIALGAFSKGRSVGIGVVVPHLRPRIAQVAFLHVSAAFRATGIGRRLSDELDLIARDAGDTEIVVSATPSENTRCASTEVAATNSWPKHCRNCMNSSPRSCT